VEHLGDLVGSRYRITVKIGAGGMGVVYRADDEQLHRPVAIKILPDDVGRDVDRLARFKNEARALSALNHPNIVTIYEIGVAGAVPFIAMELVEGQTLRERLRAGGLQLRDALDVSLQVARALAAAHAATATPRCSTSASPASGPQSSPSGRRSRRLPLPRWVRRSRAHPPICRRSRSRALPSTPAPTSLHWA
jgi:serine/threonine protein kinase